MSIGLCRSNAIADQPLPDESVLQKLADDPSTLRSTSMLRDLKTQDHASLAPLMRKITTDQSQAWDIRARAATYLSGPKNRTAVTDFSESFEPLTVARNPWGAETYQILAEWGSRSEFGQTAIGPLLIPTESPETVDRVLVALAGNGIHHYLSYLEDHDYIFRSSTVAALGETDDQLTRQFLCWWVGEHRPRAMAPFLLDQIGSPRSSSYRSQVDRVFLALFTAGIGELIRSAIPTPRWLQDDATPKGLALESLARYYPSGTLIDNSTVVDALVSATETNAAGKDRGQWQLAIDILLFLEQRKQPLAGRAEMAAGDMVRQVLGKRGPLEPFIAVAELNRRTDLSFPPLGADEQARVWKVASKTLDAAYLKAVVDHLPDDQQREQLERRLLGLGDQAARGTLRVVRCWGADIETPGDWAAAVAALRLVEAIDDVEGVLDTSWPDQAVEALIRFGAPGAPALGRFLLTSRSRQLDSDLRRRAIESCALYLPENDWQSLLALLESDPALAEGGTTSTP